MRKLLKFEKLEARATKTDVPKISAWQLSSLLQVLPKLQLPKHSGTVIWCS